MFYDDVEDDEEESYIDPACYEVYDQQDYSVLLEDVPYINEVKIPGINLADYEPLTGRLFPCEKCGNWMPEEQYENTTIYGNHLCAQCKTEYDKTELGKVENIITLSYEPFQTSFSVPALRRSAGGDPAAGGKLPVR